MIKPKTNKNVVKQSNSFILARYQNSMTIREIRLFMSILALRDTKQFPKVVISEDELKFAMNISPNDKGFISDLRKWSKKLIGRYVELKNDKGGWTLQSIISTITSDPDLKTITFLFDQTMYDHIVHIKEGNFYTSLFLDFPMSLNSFYSVRLYTVLMTQKWQERTKVKSMSFVIDPEFEEEDIRYLGDLLGYSGKSYSKYGQLNNRILSPALLEINEKTNISISTPILRRWNNKTIGFTLEYEVSNVNPNHQINLRSDPTSNALLKRLKDFDIKDAIAKKILQEYSAEYVSVNLGWVNNEIRSGREIKNLSGYVLTAIRDNYSSASLDSHQNSNNWFPDSDYLKNLMVMDCVEREYYLSNFDEFKKESMLDDSLSSSEMDDLFHKWILEKMSYQGEEIVLLDQKIEPKKIKKDTGSKRDQVNRAIRDIHNTNW